MSSIGHHFGGKEALMNKAVAETTRACTRSIEAEVWKDATEHPAEQRDVHRHGIRELPT
jgi:hypothetical protein